MKRALLITLIVLVGGAAIGWWWLSMYERAERKVFLPPRGEARWNPLYALKLTLEARNLPVAVHAHIDPERVKLGEHDTIVLISDVRAMSPVVARRLAAWVKRGGHLVFPIPSSGEGRSGELMESFNLDVSAGFVCTHWDVPKEAIDKDADGGGGICNPTAIALADDEDEFDWLWGNPESGWFFARRDWGEGSWLAAADLAFLTNRGLDDPGNAALAWQVLAPMLGQGKVHLVYSADMPPLYVLLLRHAWPVVVLLALALAAWLWRRSQRLGPLLPLAPPDRRALLEHVQAAGELAFRRGRALALHAATHRAFIERLQRRDPALASLPPDQLAQALAQRAGLPVADVQHALQPTDVAHPERFVAAIRTLMLLQAKP